MAQYVAALDGDPGRRGDVPTQQNCEVVGTVLLSMPGTNLYPEVCLCLFLSCRELALQRKLDALHRRLLGATNIRAGLSERCVVP